MNVKLSDAIIDLRFVRHVVNGTNETGKYTQFLDENSEVLIELEREISADELNLVYDEMSKMRPHLVNDTLYAPGMFCSVIGVSEVRLSHARSILVYSDGYEVDVGVRLSVAIVEKIHELQPAKKNDGDNLPIQKNKKIFKSKK